MALVHTYIILVTVYHYLHHRLDCALYLAIQKGHVKAIALLLLCKATIMADSQAIRSLLSEPADSNHAPWYMEEVHQLLSRGTVKMCCPIAVSVMEKNYEATKELLLRTDLDMRRKQVDWSRLKLTILHSSWVYSIAPWVVNLKLGNNNLRQLPQEFEQASQLRRLDLSHNLLDVVHTHLFSLPNLEFFNLSHNKLREISETTCWSSSLISLDLSHNQLTGLPASIQDSSLEILNLSKNKFTSVPKSLCRIRSLTALDLSSMPISSLPREMELLEHLANLNVANCSINDLPHGVNMRNVGPRGIFKARARSSKACNYIKLVVLCNSNAGKLVMYSRLRQSSTPPSLPLPDMEVFQWTHRPFLTRKLFASLKLVFNTWIVGVEQECCSLYPSLYTANALYVLVWDVTRALDMKDLLRPYVDGIYRHNPTANVLVVVVLPDSQESTSESATSGIVRRLVSVFSQTTYAGLQFQGTCFTSSNPASKDTQVDIRMKIYEIAANMTVSGIPIVSHQYPENYFNLISILEKQHAQLRVGGKSGILEQSALWAMFEDALGQETPDSMELPVITSFLSEAGYLMHFEDPNMHLDHYYFLHPGWVVSNIHQLLHCLHQQYVSKPIISYAQLVRQLHLGKSSKKPVIAAIIRLMVRFTIVLPVGHSDYLIPSLLPPAGPPIALVQQDSCFRRQFMPKSRPLPNDFWLYLITQVMFNLPRILETDFQQQVLPTSSRTSSLSQDEAGDGMSSTPGSPDKVSTPGEEEGRPRKDSLDLTTGMDFPDGRSHIAAPMPSSPINEADGAIELLTKQPLRAEIASPTEGGLSGHRPRVMSPTKLKRHQHDDPVHILPGVRVWKSGILFQRGQLRFNIYSQIAEIGPEENGIEVCVSSGDQGRRVMARLCWLIQKLLDQRYHHFSSEVHMSSNDGMTQIIMCPLCIKERYISGGVTNFVIETCFVALKEQGCLSHSCHRHKEPIPLSDLIPEYMLVDMPASLHLSDSSFTFSESRPVHRDSYTVLFEGVFGEQPVTVKLHMVQESRSFAVPLTAVRQEVEMLTHIHHPNIIRTFGFCLQPQCVVLERAPLGSLLQKLMDNEQKISRLVRFHVARQIASALNYLHHRGIIYRTLKADSILTWSLAFEDEISVKLANFDQAEYSTPSGLLGRAEFSSYPAPEMVRYTFHEEYTEKVDIYSFGVLLYELVARWQPFASERISIPHRPKLTGLVTYGFHTLVKLMENCWEEDTTLRPSASHLVNLISQPSFQCHLSTQVLRDCVSVRGCCMTPSLRQIWAYGEYDASCHYPVESAHELVEGTQVFILNADNLTIQGSLELKERANAICTVDSKVWIGMLEACIHAYDAATFIFTDRVYVKDSVTAIAANDTFAFVGLANGSLTYFNKLQFPHVHDTVAVGTKAIMCMLPVAESVWLNCGNEIIVLGTDEEEVSIAKRWPACHSDDQVLSLVLSKNGKVVWSIVRGSLTISSWQVNSFEPCGSVSIQENLRLVCCDLNIDPAHLRLLSLESSQDVLWLGLSCGVIVILTATEEPEMLTFFRAHHRGIRCLLEVEREESSVVLSGGYGEESSLQTEASAETGVIMSWQNLKAHDFRLLVRRMISQQ